MPDVHVAGATRLERFVAVAGRELRVENPLGLDPLVDTRRALAAWPAEAERIRRAGIAWKIDAVDWRLLLVPTQPTLATPFRVYLHEQSAGLLDGQRWLHQATYWMYHETGADLAVELPAAAQLLSVTVDGAEVTRIQPAPDRLWLPLSSRSGSFVLRLCWSYAAEAEPLTRPRLDRPRLEGAEPALTLWTCHVPVGFRLSAGHGQDDDATLALRRAEAMLELGAALAALPPSDERDQQLRVVQVNFYRGLRRAEQALGNHHERVKQARERALEQAKTGNYEPLRDRAEQEARQARSDSERREQTNLAPLLAERGTPASFAAVDVNETPRPTIVSLQSQRTRRNFEFTVLFLVLLGTLVGIGLFPAALEWQRRLWPEQLIGLGCLGWLALGPGWLFVFFVVLGVCGRLVLFLAGLGRLLQRLAPLPNWNK
jgi:hypothetical protein